MSQTGSRRSIWLIVSLCLNVVLIAMMAMGIARAWHREHEKTLGRAFSAESILAHLPPDRAAKVQAVLDAHAPALKELNDGALQARLHARPIFMAPVFDANAYAQAQQGLRIADDALEAERLKQTADIAAVLTPTERADIVERAREQSDKRP